jgi:Holliday junction resolvase YEN1
MLRCFGIPYHEAPGEAEAECARLQVLGVVDAVWSQDSDCIMFGCNLWIHDDRVAKEKGNTNRAKDKTKKNAKTVLVVRSRSLEEQCGLDREGLVLFAMLVGGDYQASGLRGCGVAAAMHAIKAGLGHDLCSCKSQQDCRMFSARLYDFFRTTPRLRHIDIPSDFPDFKILQKYNSPKVSSDEALRNSPRLDLSSVRSIQELKLLKVTSSRFNIWGRKYMDWVGPILLTRSLANRDSTLAREVVHSIKLTKRRPNKTDDLLPPRSFERKLTFSPFSVTSLQRSDFEGERLGYWDGKIDVSFDADHRVECEIPDYWLQKVLPNEVLEPPAPEPKRRSPKRKRQTGDEVQTAEPSVATKRGRKAKVAEPLGTTAQSPDRSIEAVQSSQRPSTSSLPHQGSGGSAGRTFFEISDSEDEDALRIPKPRTVRSEVSRNIRSGFSDPWKEASSHAFAIRSPKTPTSMRPHTNSMISNMDEEERDRQLALQLSMKGVNIPSSTLASRDSVSLTRYAANHENIVRSSGSWPAQTLSRHPFPGSTTSYEKTSQALAAGPNSSAEPAGQDFTSTASEDIRAARLQHFLPSLRKSYSATETSKSSLSPGAIPNKRIRSSLPLPTGVDCIDLTGD